MKKIIALLLSAIMVFALAATVMAGEGGSDIDIDSIEIDDLMEYAKAYKRTYKSAFSLFADMQYYFTEAEPDDAFGEVTEYNPNFKDFDLQNNASAFVELRGLFGNVDRYNQTRLINIKQQFGLLDRKSTPELQSRI